MQDFTRLIRLLPTHRITGLTVGLLTLFLIFLVLYPRTQQILARSNQNDHKPMPINTLIELNTQTAAEMETAIDFIENLGGNVPLSFAPRILFAQLPDGIDSNSWIGQVGIEAIYAGEATIKSSDSHDQLAARVWNTWQVDHPFACCENPDTQRRWLPSYQSLLEYGGLVNNMTSMSAVSENILANATTLATVDLATEPEKVKLSEPNHTAPGVVPLPLLSLSESDQQQDRDPLFFVSSAFYIGDYQVDLMLPESETGDENWSPTRRDEVVVGVVSGILWWVATSQKRIGRPIDLSYNVTVHDPFITPHHVRTKYEPIQTISQATAGQDAVNVTDRDWIGELMENMGERGENPPGGASSFHTSMWDYVDKRRKEMNRDWGFIVFVVDSANDEDGMFAKVREIDQPFAYAGRPGPHIVMTYDNGPNSHQIGVVNGMKVNMAHEMAHTIGSTEEYINGCTGFDLAGYFDILNINCEVIGSNTPLEDSIMRNPLNQRVAFPQLSLSSPVRHMAGWRDSDSDGLFDPVDTVPILNVESIRLDETSQQYVYSGFATDVPYSIPKTNIRPAVTINTIKYVAYRIDDGDWYLCQPADSDQETPNENFDKTAEDFSCIFPAPESDAEDDTQHIVAFQALNSVNAYSEIVTYPLADPAVVGNKPPSGGMSIVGGSNIASDPRVHLALSTIDDGGVKDYRIKYQDEWQTLEGEDDEWKRRINNGYTAFDLDPAQTVHRLGVQYRDANDELSEEIFIEPITLDMEDPMGWLNVARVQPVEAVPQVQVTMHVTGELPSEMNFFYNNNWENWSPFASGRILGVASDGNYDFKVQYKDIAGNFSRVYSDKITVDTTVPSSQVDSPNGEIISLEPLIKWSGNDALSGIKCYDIQYSMNDGSDWTDWQNCVTQTEAVLEGEADAIYQLRSRATDNEGNEEPYSDIADVVVQFPTSTPMPTPTSIPTETSVPTMIPTPTMTPTYIPTVTSTPMPTDTAMPMPTDTAMPMPTDTATPMPTATETNPTAAEGSYMLFLPLIDK